MTEAETRSAARGASGRTLARLAALEVGVLEGVGPKRISSLEGLGISSILDLLWHYPRRYIDRTRQADLTDLAIGDEAVIMATVKKVAERRTRQGRSMVTVEVEDTTGALSVTFFNQAWRRRQLTPGAEVLLFGKLEEFRGRPKMTNPIVDLLVGIAGSQEVSRRIGRIIPVYPQSAKSGITSWELGRFIAEALDRAGQFAEPLPEHILEELDLADRTSAYRGIHAPASMEETATARRRLAFDELLRLQLALVLRRALLERDARGIRHSVEPAEAHVDAAALPTLLRQFLGSLAFEPTSAQRRVLEEIFADLMSPLPMHRLLQGDVGAGKTLVAVATMLASVQGGRQAALMAPTEVLADQHHAAIRSMLGDLTVPAPERLDGVRPLEIRLLTSSTPSAERRRTIEGLADGSVDIVVGTQALLTDDVGFASLGVAVVDEQHRFGVEQRSSLRAKGRAGESGGDPDLLVMTATPIPRSAAMVVFGDLEMSVLDELPPGRTPITTTWLRDEEEYQEAWTAVSEEVAAGHQVFVVCPLVEGSGKVEATSAVAEAHRLEEGELRGLRVGLLHGQMKVAEKDSVMTSFREGELDVLVATTVIEVGVDVPNATVMVIEDADRFGIAQLHQLRGRVGRGTVASRCFLLGSPTSPEGAARLAAVAGTTDGFVLAEVDLSLRGEGTILGSRQKGRSDLRLASLAKDRGLLESARAVAERLVADDPGLVRNRLLAEELQVTLDPQDAAWLFKG